ncbi:MAG: hypothetical protein KAW14_00525 [Candidatus Aegiribacteria sp.]|nr:hypothetical protein [Candidatus Aegiribacteria sp.]
MRKLLAVLSIAGLVIMACGGGGAGNPEDAVTGFYDALKGGDIDKAAGFIQGGIPEEERPMFADIGPMMEMMEFEVTGSEIAEDGKSAVVFTSTGFMGEVQEDEVECVIEDGAWKMVGMGF